MVCPSCGAQIDGHGKFCAVCGAHLPEAAAPPPAWSQPAAPPPPPAAYGAPPPPYGAPQYGAPPPPPYGAPGYGAPQWGAPPFAGGQYGAPYAASRPAGSASIAGLLAIVGGAAAIGSLWLPWATFATYSSVSMKLIDATDMSRLECGYYVLIGGAIAAVCGLLLLGARGMAGTRMLFGLGAIAGSALVVVVEVMAYNQMNNSVSGYAASSGLSYGLGLFVAIGGGVVGALGGLAGLVSRR